MHNIGDLRAAVIARRTELGMTATDLQRASGLSARTIREVESGDTHRRFGSTTLARLDVALGWPTGTAYARWTGDTADDMSSTVAEQLIALTERIRRMEDEPPWQRDWLSLGGQLTPDQRALLQALGTQLVASHDGHGR